MHKSLAVVALWVLAGCGGDSTGPSSASLTGTWMYNATNISGSGISCSFSSVTIAITQAGSSFVGTSSGGTFSCTAAGMTSGSPLGTATIANGKIDGSAVEFDFDTQDIHNAGTLSGNSMSGTVTVRADVGGPIITLTGSFSAVKQ